MGIVIFLVFSGCFFFGGVALYAANPPEVTNILILGSDARPGTADAEIARTDTIMVLSINPRKDTVSLFSVPRDVFIQSPRYGWLRANTVLRNAELNEAGTGVDEMIAALENTFGFQIDGYMRVDFEGFVDVVDALGGIKIDVPKRIVDDTYPTADYGVMRIEFQPGEQSMNGETALIYARTRHGDDDYNRASRQQQVVDAVLGKLINPLNVPRYPAVINAVFSNVEGDQNIGQWLANSPGILLYGRDIESFVITRDYLYNDGGQAYPQVDAIRPWIESHME